MQENELYPAEARDIFGVVLELMEKSGYNFDVKIPSVADYYNFLNGRQGSESEDVKTFIKVMCKVMKHVCPLVGEGPPVAREYPFCDSEGCCPTEDECNE